MINPKAVTKEYKKVCEAMRNIVEKGGSHSRAPLEEDEELYGRLEAVNKDTGMGSPKTDKDKSQRHR